MRSGQPSCYIHTYGISSKPAEAKQCAQTHVNLVSGGRLVRGEFRNVGKNVNADHLDDPARIAGCRRGDSECTHDVCARKFKLMFICECGIFCFVSVLHLRI